MRKNCGIELQLRLQVRQQGKCNEKQDGEQVGKRVMTGIGVVDMDIMAGQKSEERERRKRQEKERAADVVSNGVVGIMPDRVVAVMVANGVAGVAYAKEDNWGV